MKMIICLHGNPLQGQEFDPLLPELTHQGFHPILHKRPIKGSKLEPLLQSINSTAKVSGGGPFILVAYSWGAYLALAYLHRFPENVTGLLLINPLVVDHKPMSAAVNLLMATPLLRSIVLRLRSRSMAAAYVRRTFAPHEPTQQVRSELESFLSQVQIWRGAAAYKKLMMTTPLPDQVEKSSVPIRVLYGEKDLVAPINEQKPVIERFGYPITTTIPGAGHGLPWTHPSLILEEIKTKLD